MNQNKALNILVVDDCATTRCLLGGILRSLSVDACLIEAEDGADAMARLHDQDVDIVFLDVNMPGLSGLDALKQLREIGNDVFVTLMSIDAEEAQIKSGTRLGSYDFLPKPLDRDHVASILNSYRNLSQRKKVMIVDDSSAIRRLVMAVLVKSQFDMLISEVSDGPEALAVLKGTNPDIVFLDYHMPGLDGIEAAQLLRAANPELTIVLMSERDLSRDIGKIREAGIYAILKKPFFTREVDFVLHRIYGLALPYSLGPTPNVTLFEDVPAQIAV